MCTTYVYTAANTRKCVFLAIQSQLVILNGLKAEVTMQRCWEFDFLKPKEAKI